MKPKNWLGGAEAASIAFYTKRGSFIKGRGGKDEGKKLKRGGRVKREFSLGVIEDFALTTL